MYTTYRSGAEIHSSNQPIIPSWRCCPACQSTTSRHVIPFLISFPFGDFVPDAIQYYVIRVPQQPTDLCRRFKVSFKKKNYHNSPCFGSALTQPRSFTASLFCSFLSFSFNSIEQPTIRTVPSKTKVIVGPRMNPPDPDGSSMTV